MCCKHRAKTAKTSEILDRPSLVVIIDCWNNQEHDHYLATLNNIRHFCETNINVQSIAVASYIGLDNKIFAKEEPWWGNGYELFYNTTRWETLRQVWNETRFQLDHLTHPIIQGIVKRSDQTQFIMWHSLQTLYYCNHINPAIENIFIVGQSWDHCLEFRSVGWKELDNLNTYNLFDKKKTILSKKDCVTGVNNSVVNNVSLPWVELDDQYLMLDSNIWKDMPQPY